MLDEEIKRKDGLVVHIFETGETDREELLSNDEIGVGRYAVHLIREERDEIESYKFARKSEALKFFNRVKKEVICGGS